MIIFAWYRIYRMFSTGFRTLSNKIKFTIFFGSILEFCSGLFLISILVKAEVSEKKERSGRLKKCIEKRKLCKFFF